jgi:hypothetical protein
MDGWKRSAKEKEDEREENRARQRQSGRRGDSVRRRRPLVQLYKVGSELQRRAEEEEEKD